MPVRARKRRERQKAREYRIRETVYKRRRGGGGNFYRRIIIIIILYRSSFWTFIIYFCRSARVWKIDVSLATPAVEHIIKGKIFHVHVAAGSSNIFSRRPGDTTASSYLVYTRRVPLRLYIYIIMFHSFSSTNNNNNNRNPLIYTPIIHLNNRRIRACRGWR